MNIAIRSSTLDTAQPASEGSMELLLWILVWSELVVFGALLGAFMPLATLDPSAMTALHGELDLPLAGVATATLLTSGCFAAQAAFGHNPRRNLVIAALGGFAFCGLKVAAFSHELPVLAATEGRLAELYMLIVVSTSRMCCLSRACCCSSPGGRHLATSPRSRPSGT